ncbi:MAG TPA: hypothetical protein VIE15_02785 [Acidimicrobiales bacterium]|jgi:hypothetical protein
MHIVRVGHEMAFSESNLPTPFGLGQTDHVPRCSLSTRVRVPGAVVLHPTSKHIVAVGHATDSNRFSREPTLRLGEITNPRGLTIAPAAIGRTASAKAATTVAARAEVAGPTPGKRARALRADRA